VTNEDVSHFFSINLSCCGNAFSFLAKAINHHKENFKGASFTDGGNAAINSIATSSGAHRAQEEMSTSPVAIV
jgi:hypothetical protein